jgi:uncharacterized protein YdeI (YjbR/CyaY-like superfamily)
MKLGKTLYVPDRKAWRAWLSKHYDKEGEIWLVYPKKASKKPRISYNDAVEEALCFGWIDSTVKRIDSKKFAQRFSPRNPKSTYSQANVERLRKLVKRRKVMKPMLAALGPVLDKKFEIPPDILGEIMADREAWENFQKFSDSYRRIRIAFIDAARKRPGEFGKRLHHFVDMTKKNKQFGFGGVEKYF